MKNDTQERKKLFTRRTVLLTAGKAMVLAGLGARLFHLQVSEGKKYAELAEGNRIRVVPIIARRGRILDRNGKLIVDGVPRYQLEFDPIDYSTSEENFKKVAKVIKLPKYRYDEILAEIKSGKAKYLGYKSASTQA
jgi:penicillin-binding protein 2